jgi:hypothetical protein
MQNTRKVAEPDNQQESKTFSLNRMGCQRFMDREWPGNAETKKHKNFKNAHLSNHLDTVVGPCYIQLDKFHCLVCGLTNHQILDIRILSERLQTHF